MAIRLRESNSVCNHTRTELDDTKYCDCSTTSMENITRIDDVVGHRLEILRLTFPSD